ncbi:hypothetical protein FACS1894216_07920 [Synergistales bacterium]|nr:hypothetical protein FACS1894216_07920 [Synergistales bacterium]
MAQSMADDIRDKEAGAKKIVASAREEAARIQAAARAVAEQSVKDAKQKAHRSFRDQTKQAEAEAANKAVETVNKGRGAADGFYASGKSKVSGIADWLVKEVMTAYGNS